MGCEGTNRPFAGCCCAGRKDGIGRMDGAFIDELCEVFPVLLYPVLLYPCCCGAIIEGRTIVPEYVDILVPT
ncbi:MAG: hypothetical protein D3916_19275 [Candidatus Electrothrix sp. MAN1_4]|nr:hypothetical protein [Candidatus Electrothrix sp. MAN1_4]